jgi:hypothetical protein
MRYSVPQLAIFFIAALILAACSAAGVNLLVIPCLNTIDADLAKAVDQFFFGTGIQWCTFTVFFFIMVILVARMIEQRAIKRSLILLRNRDPKRTCSPSDIPSKFVGERISQVDESARTKGPIEATSLAGIISESNSEGSGAVFGLLGTAVQLMLAIGFFGTVWGISRSMFKSFTGLAGNTAEQISQALGQFTSGLSTALDTTVAALVCAIFSGLWMAAVEWAEEEVLKDLADYLHDRASQGDSRLELTEQRVLEKLLPLIRDLVHQNIRSDHGRTMEQDTSSKDPGFDTIPGTNDS